MNSFVGSVLMAGQVFLSAPSALASSSHHFGVPLVQPRVSMLDGAAENDEFAVDIKWPLLDLLRPGVDGAVPQIPFHFVLADDLAVDVVFHAVTSRTHGVGSPADPDAVELIYDGVVVGDLYSGTVRLMLQGSHARGFIHVDGVGSYELASNRHGHTITPAADHGEPAPPLIESGLLGTPVWDPSDFESGGVAGAPSCDDGNVIDVIVLYSPDAVAAAACTPTGGTGTGGGCQAPYDPEDESFIRADIEDCVDYVNTVLSNTGFTDLEFRLIYAGLIDYDDSSAGSTNLTRLIAPWDNAIDEAHDLRDRMHADMVSLWTASAGFAGIAQLFGPFTNQITGNSPATTLTAHEWGHCLGTSHDRPCENCVNDCNCTVGIFPYSFAYKFTVGTTPHYTTTSCPTGGIGIPYYSNPAITYMGVSIGEPILINGNPNCNAADDYTTFQNTRDAITQWRLSVDTTDTTARASLAPAGQSSGGVSSSADLSNNGRWIAFHSGATNIAGTDSNSASDVFVYDRENRTILLLSFQNGAITTTANGQSLNAAISADGHYVAFESEASNLTASSGPGADPDTNGERDIFIVPQDNRPERISVDSSEAESDGDSFAASLDAEGDFVVYESNATNLVASDTNGARDIFLRDRAAGDTKRLSVDTSGNQANGMSLSSRISEDGRSVAFASAATNLVASDTNGVTDIFIRDRDTDTDDIFDESGAVATVRISVKSDGTAANGNCSWPSISADGRYVAFASSANNLVSGDTNAVSDVFVHDRDSDADGIYDESGALATTRVSVTSGGTEGNAASLTPAISADGRYIAFSSIATNLATGTSGYQVYLHDRNTGATTLVSVDSSGTVANDDGRVPAISDDGRFIAYHSEATNLVASDTNGDSDIFFRDRGPQLLGDLNADHVIDELDEDIVLQNWGACDCCAADLDQDGDVDDDDLDLLGL
jgi:Tol biopolymer transport system component